MKNKKQKINEYKEKYCEYCDNKHSCCDLDGDVIDEQIDICINANKIKHTGGKNGK